MDFSTYNYIVYAYIIFVAYYVYKISLNKTLYIFSPFLLYVTFIIGDLLPVYMPHERVISNVMYRNNVIAIIINILCIFYYSKVYKIKATLEIPKIQPSIAKRRVVLFCICICLLLLSGLISGTLMGFIHGEDMEDARRVEEIGIGFIRDIPDLMLRILGLIILLTFFKKKFFLSGVICICLGSFEVAISGGNRAPLLAWVIIFLVYFGIAKRGLKWWEYIIYLIAFNVVALVLGYIRRGLVLDDVFSEFSLLDGFSGNQNIFYDNSIAIVDLTKGGHFFYGQDLYSTLVYFIPRFLWPDKPISFGYTLKELADYSFDGGGIGATLIENMYANWGDFWIITYLFWIYFIHKLYTTYLSSNSYYCKIILMILLITGNRETDVIKNGELLLLCLFIFRLFYQRKKVI